MKYDVQADLYEGPLPLLVELAKLNLLDLFLIKLQALTQQYLAVVKTDHRSLNELAEPLPLLGQLMAMKSRLLLPQPPRVEDEEEAPISLEELQRRLAEHEQFKTVAQVLAELHALQHTYFTRARSQELAELAGQVPEGAMSPDVAQPGQEVGLLDLMTAFAKVLERTNAPVYEVEQEAWTVEMKVEELKRLLSVKHQMAFGELFSPAQTRLELVVTFLALLELVRQHLCMAVQEQPFAEILVVSRDITEQEHTHQSIVHRP
ncbi:MAG: segregation/condensation protein A [Candidatus Omnitrophica bacterium]|nr:segregation/condensation protein A [Candidatus Omnitrophota bacterium]